MEGLRALTGPGATLRASHTPPGLLLASEELGVQPWLGGNIQVLDTQSQVQNKVNFLNEKLRSVEISFPSQSFAVRIYTNYRDQEHSLGGSV